MNGAKDNRITMTRGELIGTAAQLVLFPGFVYAEGAAQRAGQAGVYVPYPQSTSDEDTKGFLWFTFMLGAVGATIGSGITNALVPEAAPLQEKLTAFGGGLAFGAFVATWGLYNAIGVLCGVQYDAKALWANAKRSTFGRKAASIMNEPASNPRADGGRIANKKTFEGPKNH